MRAQTGGVVTDHIPDRPSWRCRSCGDPWPCDQARDQLAARMDKVALATHMWAQLDHAFDDQPIGPPAEMFDRFIHWTH
jgi:hypothetical protein